tara:strand:+ start:7802 stop:8098 length:297 start_codon:yes stop_codon:yes gene_type:complete
MPGHLSGDGGDDNVLIRLGRGFAGTVALHGGGAVRCFREQTSMNLPKLSLDSLPGLIDAPGLIGSLSDLASATTDDRVVILMVYLYETFPPEVPTGLF